MKKNKKVNVKNKPKKNIQQSELDVLAKGVFKARKWPWVFSIVTILALVIYVSVIAYEYLGYGTCGFCASFRQHMSYYFSTFTTLFIAWIVASALAFLLSIWPKRTLTLTTSKICFKSGRRDIRIPICVLERVTATKNGTLKITVPLEKFKFKNLKNANDICRTILSYMSPSTALSITPETPVVAAKKEESLSASKIRYFQKLYNDGVITELQFNEYVAKALETNN